MNKDCLDLFLGCFANVTQCGYFLLQAIRDTGKDPFLRDAPLTAHGRMQAQEAQEKLRELQEDDLFMIAGENRL